MRFPAALNLVSKQLLRYLLLCVCALAICPDDSAAATKKKPTRKAKPVATVPAVKPPLVDPKSVASDALPVVAEFNHWVDQIEQSGNVSGLAVSIVHGDKVLLERGIGYADWKSREPITVDTVFRLASLSKGFATTLTGLLVEDGKMSWDTRITNVLPTFSLSDINSTQKLTLRDILSHRVGLPHNTYDNLIEGNEPYPLLVERLSEVPMACPAGDCYGYQNIAFSLIGDITYALTGDFFYHLVEKRLFHPLGMHTATYGRDALEHSKRWARPHRRAGKEWKSFLPNETYYHMPPAAGANASVRDMQRWLVAQMGLRPDVLGPELLEDLHTPLVRTPKDMSSTPWRRGRLHDAEYALGWRVYDYAGERMIFHAGAVQGYRAMIGFLPKHQFGVVMLWNCESAAPSGLMPMLFDRYLGLPRVDWAGVGNVDLSTISGGDERAD
jgi:beta-lactamase class C